MILKTLQIQNYKCVEDSTEFRIDEVTCLVGKNESGKSAILESLYKLKPVEKDKANFAETEYPRRHVSTYRDRDNQDTHDNVLTTIWELEDSDVLAVEEYFGINPLTSQTVTVTKGYSNSRSWTLQHNDKSLVSKALTDSNLSEIEKEALPSTDSIAQLMNLLSEIEAPSDAQTQLLSTLKQRYPNSDAGAAIRNFLADRLPIFVYFSEYYKMPGRAALNDISARKQQDTLDEKDKVFLAFLDLANSSVEGVANTGTSEELIMELEAVSNRISDEIFEYWSQNQHLRVQFRCDQARPQDHPPFNEGYVFSTRIENQRHRVTVNFDERSTGFIWFFSFLVWFSQVKKHYGKNLFILLDEPGLSLHGTAQADLLRYINEKLRPQHQVIYTTHSPFMIDPDHILSARTVEDHTSKDARGREIIEGTKVGDRILSTDADTILPLQGALGYDITQTLFVGAHTLIVEGPSDYLFLKTLSNELQRLKRPHLDPRWSIAPAGGLDKVMSFVILFGGRHLHIAVLTDIKQGDKTKVQKLREAEILRSGHVLTADSYAGQNEADIEDILGRTTYVEIVNKCYALSKSLEGLWQFWPHHNRRRYAAPVL